MKNRTIEELHDKRIGHKKFAKICDLLIEAGYQVTDIKEFNEQFKFKCNGYQYNYRKEWKSSSKDFVKYLINLVNSEEELKKWMN